ncbi:Protein strawberry notch 1 [Chamberlinius hualienensis]
MAANLNGNGDGGGDLLSAALMESGCLFEQPNFALRTNENGLKSSDGKRNFAYGENSMWKTRGLPQTGGPNVIPGPMTGLTPLARMQQMQSLVQPRAATVVLKSSAEMSGRSTAVTSVRTPFNNNAAVNMTNGIIFPNSASHLAKLWNSQDSIKNIEKSVVVKQEVEGELEEEDDEENIGPAETYADYMPSKLKIGEKHPDPVVETSSLSSVQPPEVTYNLSIPEACIDYGHLSALQLEAVVYASQQHEQFLADGTRAGFLIGDGAGVGKGRTIAGIIYENYLLGRKRALWVSVSNDLKYDAERDLKDIGAGKIEVHSLNKFKYAKISSKTNGSVKRGVVFSTYSSLIGESQSRGKYKTRLKQLLHWCGEEFDGVIVFDECHKAKNLCPAGSTKPTKTGLTVLELQKLLPKARIVYASATGASEPKNMAYMVRLGLWGLASPFAEFSDFIQAVEKRGVGAMEIVAMDMKLRGSYIARQLSFSGVSFKIEEIPLADKFIEVYNQSVKLWVEAREKFQLAVDLIDVEQRMKKTMWGQFWSAHQRFFKYMCIASKVDFVVKLAREAVKSNKCVVIGLQSTGEARTLEQLEEAGGELNDFVSTAKGVFQALIEKHFPAPDRKRIQRLLGIETSVDVNSDSQSPSSSSKQERRVRQTKKSYTEDKLSDDTGDSNGEDSDFEFSASEEEEEASDESRSDDDDSNLSDLEGESDYNPFGSDGSDSDEDPWLNRKSKKKSKKKKKPSPVKRKAKSQKNPSEVKRRLNGCETETMEEGMESKPIVPVVAPRDAAERACSMKEELLMKLEKLGPELPPNTLDQLIDELGGPENVAEMTGRKGRVVSNEEGVIQYESRSEFDVPLETLNITEKQRFMDGEKQIAIISEAASSGISLQSDRREKNQMRRVHITLELPWSADRAIQQFGRTHRSNQVNAPEYLFLISDLAGERRFASIVAKRLESLGALTHGDRRATESRDLSQFNIDNKFGRTALETVMKSVMGYEMPLVEPPCDQSSRMDFFQDVQKALIGVGLIARDENNPKILSLDKDYNNMSKFLNRILGLEVSLQNKLFKYFSDTLAAVISQAKKAGRFDMGILDLGTGEDQAKRFKCDNFIIRHATGKAKIELHTLSVERGVSWKQALEKWQELIGASEGFYLSQQARNSHQTTVLAVCNVSSGRKKDKKDKGEKLYSIYRPNSGVQQRMESIAEIKRKYKKVVPDEAQPHWEEQFTRSNEMCSHKFWRGSCRRTDVMGLPCDVGRRTKLYHILSGSVLSVWSKVEGVMSANTVGHGSRMQIIRVKTTDGVRIVGLIIPLNCYGPLVNCLSENCVKTYTESFDS